MELYVDKMQTVKVLLKSTWCSFCLKVQKRRAHDVSQVQRRPIFYTGRRRDREVRISENLPTSHMQSIAGLRSPISIPADGMHQPTETHAPSWTRVKLLVFQYNTMSDRLMPETLYFTVVSSFTRVPLIPLTPEINGNH